MNRIIHLCQSVRGALINYNTPKKMQKAFKGCITTDEGKVLTDGREITEFFMNELSKGHEVLPLSADCDNFDWKKGCRGHNADMP